MALAFADERHIEEILHYLDSRSDLIVMTFSEGYCVIDMQLFVCFGFLCRFQHLGSYLSGQST